ncbi:MAG: orotidine-5'-phosphate decarboxylase [Filifactoraceae bacterium]
MIMENLRERVLERSPFCVGIDLRDDHIPTEIVEAYKSMEDRYTIYGKEIIDASREYAACYKIQSACYEAKGLSGLRAYKNIIEYARSKGEIVIADIKRGDIGSTAKLYAEGHFNGDFESDIITINPYMGYDSINPYFDYFVKKNKGAFVLAKTSNLGSNDFQDLRLDGEPLFSRVLDKIYTWGLETREEAEFSSLGAVIGVNQLKELDIIKEKSKNIFLLIPGYGAQGAKLEDIAYVIRDRKNGVVNISRGYTADIKSQDFRRELLERAQSFAKELKGCIN